uniref:Protein kinase domain-containing protein n=1 Tax=Oryzias melastigma TaxID=30732 RepID=A0A3B3BE39_ORYME
MSQENLEKNDLKTNRDKAKKPKGKKKEKACVVKTGQILVGNLGTYEIGEFLGKGSYGEVFKCWKVGSEDFFAIKIIKDVSAGKEEVEAMKLIKDLDPDKHHLSKLYEHFSYRNVICLVYEILEKSLQNELGKPLHLVGIRAIAGQMFQALDALKSIGVVHGDIKPDNILFVRSEEYLRLKLIDFGFATKAEELLRGTEIQVTPFRAPEVILGLPLDESIDMWAFGVVLFGLSGWVECPCPTGCSLRDRPLLLQLRQLRHLVQVLPYFLPGRCSVYVTLGGDPQTR